MKGVGSHSLQEELEDTRSLGSEEISELYDVSLKDLQKILAEFARTRDWDQYHSPRNLLLALVGEVGELSEIFQWKGEVEKGLPNWKSDEREHLGEELSDVLLYLVRLADICGVDLGQAALRKLRKNEARFPVGRIASCSVVVEEGSSKTLILD